MSISEVSEQRVVERLLALKAAECAQNNIFLQIYPKIFC